VGPAQSYDIQLMLFVLPYVLLGAITESGADARSHSAAAAVPKSGVGPDGQAAQTAILEEVAAVATRCCGGAGLDAVTQPTAQPREALHLQAILGALDTLKRCVLPPHLHACSAHARAHGGERCLWHRGRVPVQVVAGDGGCMCQRPG